MAKWSFFIRLNHLDAKLNPDISAMDNNNWVNFNFNKGFNKVETSDKQILNRVEDNINV